MTRTCARCNKVSIINDGAEIYCLLCCRTPDWARIERESRALAMTRASLARSQREHGR